MIYNKTISRMIWSVTGLLLATLAIGTVHGCGGPEDRKAMYRNRAHEYIRHGNYPKARVALRNVLKIDPKDVDAFCLFAEVEEREKNWRNAYANYLRVLELEPNHEAALVKLGKIYLEGRAFDKADDIVARLLATYPGHVQGRAIRIAIHAVQGQSDESQRQAETLHHEHPDTPDVAMLLSAFYNAQNRLNDSERVLQLALTFHPQDLELLNALASTYVRGERWPQAEQTFLQIVQTEPSSFDHRLRLAGFYDQRHDYGKAEEVLREAIRLAPEHVQRYLTLADFQANRRGVAAGERVFMEAIEVLPRATALQFALGRLYEQSKQSEKARAVYESIRETHADKPVALEARVRLASLEWDQGHEAAAVHELEAVLHENPRAADAVLLKGKSALRRGQGKEAVQSFRTVLKDQPDLAEAHALLGQGYLILGETSLARESLDRAITLNPRQFEAHVALANLDMAAGRKREARLRLEQVLTVDPSNVGILGLLLNMQTSEKDWTGSQDTLARMRANGSQRVVTDLAEGYFHQARQEYEQAASAFMRAQQATPDSPEPLMALTRLDMTQGKVGHAQARLEALLAAYPSHAYAHGLLGELLLLK
ncbi:MAG TPA: tetratricopeptide repeat protein, partial [Nitrospiraceae bacterium]